MPLVILVILWSSLGTITEMGYTLQSVGLSLYNHLLFVDAFFVRNIVESLGELLLQLMLILIFALFTAVVLNRKFGGRGGFRVILFMPIVISTGVIVAAQGSSFQGVTSSLATTSDSFFSSMNLEQLLLSLKLDARMMNVVIYAVNSIYSIIMRSGVQMVIFLAGLQSITPSVYESASVEGASWWEIFWKITVPMISPLVVVNTVYTVVDSFVGNENVVMADIYSTIMGKVDFSMGSAMIVLYSLVVMTVMLVLIGIINHFTYYEHKAVKEKRK